MKDEKYLKLNMSNFIWKRENKDIFVKREIGKSTDASA